MKIKSQLKADVWVYFDAANGLAFGEVKQIPIGHCIRDEVFEIFFGFDRSQHEDIIESARITE